MQSIDARINALADRLDRGEPLTDEERVTTVQVLRAAAHLTAIGHEPDVFKVGDRVRFARRVGAESNRDDAPPIGWEGVITDIDESSLPIRVEGPSWEHRGFPQGWWFVARDLVAAA